MLSFNSMWGLWASLAVVALTALITAWRRPALPRFGFVSGCIGLVLLALGGGGLVWQRAAVQNVAVMVDLSPSTRTAEYRDRTILDRRIHELLGSAPYRLYFFASETTATEPPGQRLPDLPADSTRYLPPAAAAVLLFSDCRFALSEQSPPTYIVMDPGLDEPEDARVADLELRGPAAAITVQNTGGSRRLNLGGTAGESPTTAPAGSIVVNRPLATGAAHITAELSPGDAWPENDSLSAIIPPPAQAERWWVGRQSAPEGWRPVAPDQLPADAAAYLGAGAIVLDNTAAWDLTDVQQQRLAQYVRDLGGGLLILGGDRAFAAGGYEGTAIGDLSPLASHPPEPTTHWVLLADASGSMSSEAAGVTRWNLVTDALARLLPQLPPQDLVSVGSFAEKVDWWVEATPVRDAAALPIPRPGTSPHGPTNLQPALEAIAASANDKIPIQLLVLSDFDTRIDDPDGLSRRLSMKDIHLHLLSIGEGTALPALTKIAAATGGTVLTQLDPRRWSSSARQLARAAKPKLLETDAITVTFRADGNTTSRRVAPPWNRVWLKPTADLIGQADRGGEKLPIAARWNVGDGKVLAVAFEGNAEQASQIARQIERPPRDPRFHVTWSTGSNLRVVVDASNASEYLNDQSFTLALNDSSTSQLFRARVPQTGPGRYELSLPAPRSPAIATLRAGDRVIDRVAVAGRYAQEFDSIGNDAAAAEELARRSGGQVVPPTQLSPLRINWPRHAVALTSPLCIAGALCVAMGLIVWRLR